MNREIFSGAEKKELDGVVQLYLKGESPVLCIRDEARLKDALDHIKGSMVEHGKDLEFIEMDFRATSAPELLANLEARIGPMGDYMGADLSRHPELRDIILRVRLILINPLVVPEGSDELLFITKYVKFQVAALTVLFQKPIGLPKTVGNLVGEYSTFAHYLPPSFGRI